MREDIREIQQSLGLTSVYVTHDQEEALAVSDKIIVMNAGRIAQEGSPSDLYERPVDAFVADFIGGANLVPCEVVGVENGMARVRLAGAELLVSAPANVSGAALLVLRPNAVDLASSLTPGRSIPATVSKAVYLGSHMEYTLASPVGELFVTQPIDRQFAIGAPVFIDLPPGKIPLVAAGAGA
jgi:iron(III) transport system ATP-binding protein